MIGIVDYGLGNVVAFANAYKRMHIDHCILSDVSALEQVDRIVFPGVGAFDYAMSKFNESGMREALQAAVTEYGKPILGICVGMQMFGDSSDEGRLGGLGWIPGRTKKFVQPESARPLPLPHMGWNDVSGEPAHPLLEGLDAESVFYFLHSYYFECESGQDSIAHCDYGGPFTCATHRGNVYGVQFHPEKSHASGMRVLKNFASL